MTKKSSKENSQFTQQILFDDAEIMGKQESEQQQIIVDSQDWQTDEQAQQEIAKEHQGNAQQHSHKRFGLWSVIIVVFLILVTIELVQFFLHGFQQSPWLAALYSILFISLVIVAGRSLWRELSGLRQFKKQQRSRLMGQAVIDEEKSIDGQAFCQKITEQLPGELAEDVYENWQKQALETLSDAEIIQLYSRSVLKHVDKKALAEIAKSSTEAVVLVGLSPIAIIDMLLMLWRNLRLVNKVAAIYGLKLGYWSQVSLIKQVLQNMAYAGASELVADLGADLLGAELVGKLSARMAQGLGAGMLTARLGLQAMQVSRPLPFDETPKLANVRKEVIEQVKGLI